MDGNRRAATCRLIRHAYRFRPLNEESIVRNVNEQLSDARSTNLIKSKYSVAPPLSSPAIVVANGRMNRVRVTDGELRSQD